MDETTAPEIGTAVAAREGTEIEHAPEMDADTALVRIALEKGVDVDTIERLVALQERNAERRARMAFVRAMAAFQAEVGPIPKTGVIRDNKGNERSKWAQLHVIAEHIRGPLAKHGLSYSWDSAVTGEDLTVVCTVRHVDGHEQTGTFQCRVKDAQAPGMSGIQISGSARAYGERYSLVQALGLTTADEDTDGAGPAAADDFIDEGQEADLRALMQEVGADESRFLLFVGYSELHRIRKSDYPKAVRALEQKRAEGANGNGKAAAR